MSTLSELIHYCNEDDPVGAMLLLGEWGCGKTYLIEKDLAGALKDTHIIVKVSLFGMNDQKDLQDSVRQKWFEACLPLLGTLKRAKENTKGFWTALNGVIRVINPIAGSAGNVMTSVNALDLLPIKNEIEDIRTHEKKRVVLVYDDFERTNMNPLELLGVINDYCENSNFNTIISANEEFFIKKMEMDDATYHMLREKTVSQSIYHIPDYSSIVHSIISERTWPSPEYAEFLAEHEALILDAFISEDDITAKGIISRNNAKCHNLRSLTKGLESFFRIYYHMDSQGLEVPDGCLYSFLAFFLASKSGIYKNGEHTLEIDDSDIKQLYSKYSPELMTEAEREWIESGIWDSERYLEEMTDIYDKAPQKASAIEKTNEVIETQYGHENISQ